MTPRCQMPDAQKGRGTNPRLTRFQHPGQEQSPGNENIHHYRHRSNKSLTLLLIT